jgi:hypothetical protein
MTREERAALRAQRLKHQFDAKKRELAQAEAQHREVQRTVRGQRRYRIGTLADEAGLAVWEERTLAALFCLLARLRDLPDPVAVLDGLLSDAVVTTLTAAAAGPFLLASPDGSDSSEVSTKGVGGDAAVPEKNGVIGVSLWGNRQSPEGRERGLPHGAPAFSPDGVQERGEGRRRARAVYHA